MTYENKSWSALTLVTPPPLHPDAALLHCASHGNSMLTRRIMATGQDAAAQPHRIFQG